MLAQFKTIIQCILFFVSFFLVSFSYFHVTKLYTQTSQEEGIHNPVAYVPQYLHEFIGSHNTQIISADEKLLLFATSICPSPTQSLLLGSTDRSTSGAVSQLQLYLKQDKTLYPEGEVTGFFGRATERAMQRFQMRHGIATFGTPDTTGYGLVGKITRAKLQQLCNGTVTPNETVTPTPPTLSTSKGNTFSLTQVVSVTKVVQTKATTYTISLKDRTMRTVTIPKGTKQTLRTKLFSASGYTGSTAKLIAKAKKVRADGGNGYVQSTYATLYNQSSYATSAATCTFNGTSLQSGDSVTAYQKSNVPTGSTCSSHQRTCLAGVLTGSYTFVACSVAEPKVSCANFDNILNPQCATHKYTSEFQDLQATGGWLEPSDKNKPANKIATNLNEFKSLIFAGLQAGDIIDIDSGTWENQYLHIKANGTKEKPIVIRAKEMGGVTLTKGSAVVISGKYIVLEGFSFKGSMGSSSVALYIGGRWAGASCEHCTASNITIDDYNPSDLKRRTIYVSISGQWNRITQSTFTRKRSAGNTISTQGMAAYPDGDFYLIDRNYFNDRPNVYSLTGVSNGFETIGIYSVEKGIQTALWGPYWADSYSYIRNNYFKAQNGEGELITLKASKIGVQNNTFENSRGALTLRTSNDSVVEGNIFTASYDQAEASGGVRIIGKNHAVVHNVFQSLDPKNTKWMFPITLYSGDVDPFVAAGEQYWPVTNVAVAFNLLAYNIQNISIGDAYLNSKVPPSKSQVAYNLMHYGSRTNKANSIYIREGSDVSIHDNIATYVGNPIAGFSPRDESDLLKYAAFRYLPNSSKPDLSHIAKANRTLYKHIYDAQTTMTVAEKKDILKRMENVTARPNESIELIRYTSGNVGKEVGTQPYKISGPVLPKTNKITDFLQTALWTPSGSTFNTANGVGTLVESADNFQHQASTILTLPEGYTTSDKIDISLRARTLGATDRRLRVYALSESNQNRGYAAVRCVPQDAASSPWKGEDAKALTGSVTKEAGDWHLCTLSFTPDSTAGSKVRILFLTEASNGSVSYTGDTTAQFEIKDMSLQANKVISQSASIRNVATVYSAIYETSSKISETIVHVLQKIGHAMTEFLMLLGRFIKLV
jgi:poly(beta-D-mannuronate) lyase